MVCHGVSVPPQSKITARTAINRILRTARRRRAARPTRTPRRCPVASRRCPCCLALLSGCLAPLSGCLAPCLARYFGYVVWHQLFVPVYRCYNNGNPEQIKRGGTASGFDCSLRLLRFANRIRGPGLVRERQKGQTSRAPRSYPSRAALCTLCDHFAVLYQPICGAGECAKWARDVVVTVETRFAWRPCGCVMDPRLPA